MNYAIPSMATMVFLHKSNGQPRMLALSFTYLLCIVLALVAGQRKDSLANLGKKEKVAELRKYLGRFGYVRDYTAPENEIRRGLKVFQKFANLKITGRLDDATFKKMNDPRCGLKDPVKSLNVTRRKRYNHQGTRWLKNKLTWRYDKETRDLDRDTVRRTIRNALKLWSDRTNIEFEESTDKDADIIVQFVTISHGDPFYFDGSGGTLAHAFYPLSNTGLAGDVHFDDAETFTAGVDDPNGKDLMWVATHELGHSLGLDHTSVEGAVMYPWYTGYKEDIELDYDDIVGIQKLYGGKEYNPDATDATTTEAESSTSLTPITTKILTTEDPTTTRSTSKAPTTTRSTTKAPTTIRPTTKTPTTIRPTTKAPTTIRPTTKAPTTIRPTTKAPTTTRATTMSTTTRKRIRTLSTTREPPKDACPTSPITAVWFLPTYEYFVFITEAQEIYFIQQNGDKLAGPIPAKYYFPRNRVKDRIDSAFTHDLVFDDLRKYTIVFAGSNYFLYFRFLYMSGPHSIYDGRGPLRLDLPKYVRKVDAAFTWHKNGKVYFFSNLLYWRYDIITKSLDTGYPRLIRNGWRGVKRSVNAAFRSETDGRTLLFSGGKVYRIDDRAVHIDFGYPKNIGFDLFYCKNPKGTISAGTSKLVIEMMPDGKHP